MICNLVCVSVLCQVKSDKSLTLNWVVKPVGFVCHGMLSWINLVGLYMLRYAR